VLLATLGGLGVVLSLRAHAPTWLYLVCAALSGVGPNTGSLARARWSFLHRGDAATLHTAYAYEGVVDELCYVLGPVAAMALATSFSPLVAYLTASLLGLAGILVLATQRRTEPPPVRGLDEARTPAARTRPGGALRAAGMPALVSMLMAAGCVFGTMEITTVGFAQAHGHKAEASAWCWPATRSAPACPASPSDCGGRVARRWSGCAGRWSP
jgi:hypothetical protein